jgi:hypothetical protein
MLLPLYSLLAFIFSHNMSGRSAGPLPSFAFHALAAPAALAAAVSASSGGASLSFNEALVAHALTAAGAPLGLVHSKAASTIATTPNAARGSLAGALAAPAAAIADAAGAATAAHTAPAPMWASWLSALRRFKRRHAARAAPPLPPPLLLTLESDENDEYGADGDGSSDNRTDVGFAHQTKRARGASSISVAADVDSLRLAAMADTNGSNLLPPYPPYSYPDMHAQFQSHDEMLQQLLYGRLLPPLAPVLLPAQRPGPLLAQGPTQVPVQRPTQAPWPQPWPQPQAHTQIERRVVTVSALSRRALAAMRLRGYLHLASSALPRVPVEAAPAAVPVSRVLLGPSVPGLATATAAAAAGGKRIAAGKHATGTKADRFSAGAATAAGGSVGGGGGGGSGRASATGTVAVTVDAGASVWAGVSSRGVLPGPGATPLQPQQLPHSAASAAAMVAGLGCAVPTGAGVGAGTGASGGAGLGVGSVGAGAVSGVGVGGTGVQSQFLPPATAADADGGRLADWLWLAPRAPARRKRRSGQSASGRAVASVETAGRALSAWGAATGAQRSRQGE